MKNAKSIATAGSKTAGLIATTYKSGIIFEGWGRSNK